MVEQQQQQQQPVGQTLLQPAVHRCSSLQQLTFVLEQDAETQTVPSAWQPALSLHSQVK